jgi:hypothetical protein
VQEGFPPARIVQVDADGLDAERPAPGQRALDIGDEEVEMVRARATGGQEAVEKGGIRAPGGGQQLDFGARGEFQLAPPEPGGVAAIGPGSAKDAAEQLSAARKGRRADGEVIEDSGHGISRYGQARSEPNANELVGMTKLHGGAEPAAIAAARAAARSTLPG